MTIQKTNDDKVALLSSHFQRRYEPNFAWENAVGAISMLPGLRGFWPMSAFNASGDAWDVTQLQANLTYNGNPTYNYEGLAPYIDMDGTGDYLSNVDNAIYDITGAEGYVDTDTQGLSLGGWFMVHDPGGAYGGNTLMSKYHAAGADQRSYRLSVDATRRLYFYISSLGTWATTVIVLELPGAGDVPWDTWLFCAGTYSPSTRMTVWRNDTVEELLVGVPAGIHNGTADFRISGTHTGLYELYGRASLCWLCCQCLSDAEIVTIYRQTRALFGV